MPPRAVGLLYLLVTSVGWGLNWPAMKFLLQEWPPLFARGTSGICAAVIVALIARHRGESLAVPRDAVGRLATSAFFNVFAWMGFSTLSMRWLNTGQAALLVYTMPVWATLLSWPLLGRRPGAASVAGLVLCLAGVGILFAGSASRIAPEQALGVVFAMAAALLFALGTVVRKPLPLTPLVALAWQLAIACVPMAVIGLLLERPDFSALSSGGAAVMVYMTLVPMALCYIAWFAALRVLPPSLAAITTLLTPVIGILSAAWTLGESLGARELAAMVLTLLGVALALRDSQATPPSQAGATAPDSRPV